MACEHSQSALEPVSLTALNGSSTTNLPDTCPVSREFTASMLKFKCTCCKCTCHDCTGHNVTIIVCVCIVHVCIENVQYSQSLRVGIVLIEQCLVCITSHLEH